MRWALLLLLVLLVGCANGRITSERTFHSGGKVTEKVTMTGWVWGPAAKLESCQAPTAQTPLSSVFIPKSFPAPVRDALLAAGAQLGTPTGTSTPGCTGIYGSQLTPTGGDTLTRFTDILLGFLAGILPALAL